MVQANEDRIVVSHSGFTDKDSDIDHFEVSLGTSPGMDDLIPRRSIFSDVSATFDGMSSTLAEGQAVYGEKHALCFMCDLQLCVFFFKRCNAPSNFVRHDYAPCSIFSVVQPPLWLTTASS